MECFKVDSDDIGNRLDCFYYRSEFVALEKRVKRQTSKVLGDYIVGISGGATPDKDEAERYYSDETTGIPFLRVQNISEEGLKLDDVKFINAETHNGMLKRSQVKGGYLLTKITGVGRMAVSSVVPKGFEGNINQHLVVIKTDSYETSEVLASFLNSDIGERLAFRRSTGGTRPALDYEALKTIPIVFKPGIVGIMHKAYEEKRVKEAEAEQLLDSINDFVLKELGISLPKIANKMCFTVSSDETKKHRLDAEYYKPGFAAGFSGEELGTLALIFSGQRPKGGVRHIESGIPSLGGEHVLKSGAIKTDDLKFIPHDFHKKHMDSRIEKRDIILVKDGATTGKVGIIPEDYPYTECNINEHVFAIRILREDVSAEYLFSVLHSTIGQMQLSKNITGATVTGLTREAIGKIKIPCPSIAVQEKIAVEVRSRRERAKRLQQEAQGALETAKQQVESMIEAS